VEEDVNEVHVRLRKEARLLYSLNLDPDTVQLPSPEKDGYPPQLAWANKRSTLMRMDNLTLPDCDTFVPEFGINLPPTLVLQFQALLTDDDPSHDQREGTVLGAALTSPLRTPLHGHHDFSLQDYDIGGGGSSVDYGDDGGFDYGYDDDDDILRDANDAGTLDFNLDIPGSSSRKRGADELGGAEKRPRYGSFDEDDLRRIAAEDHDQGAQFDPLDFADGGFGDAQFDPYRTPDPVAPANAAKEEELSLPAPKKRRQRGLIVPDNATVNTDSPRAWQDNYAEAMTSLRARQEKDRGTRFAVRRAEMALWGWNGCGELHPKLATMFSRDSLLRTWGRGEKGGVKRKRDVAVGPGDVEIGMGGGGFGDGGFGDGGFGDTQGMPDALDLTVPTPQISPRS
jgi:hypothetical protein